MNKRLKRGMYGSEFKRTSNLFGIHCGQMRSGKDKRVHNGGWYNKFGEKLGWGDLSIQDFISIRGSLREDELFIILKEDASYWNFVSFQGKNRVFLAKKESYPGISYVVRHCIYIIASDSIYSVRDFEVGEDELEMRSVLRSEAEKLVISKK